MRILSLFILPITLLISGCSVFTLPTPTAQQSLIRGYTTQCRSTIEIKGVDGIFASHLLTNSGSHILTVRALSEPEQSDRYFGDDYYLCQDISEHQLHFESEGGKTYRLHLEDHGADKYTISVWEGDDRFAIETTAVPYDSQQRELRRKCRFFYECDQFIRD